ncbi:MAG: type II secretion system protein [Candidatus Omnitrophota bacterium]|jgi:prepilin-type N-terminal cleavage/methylation domain-containing protein|nr:MAG: type II secretion system protein [Candidatus Omnitrophota bacterium]
MDYDKLGIRQGKDMTGNHKAAFTIIEFIMVMVIIGVLVSTGVFIMLNLTQNSVFLPNKLNVEMAGQDIMDDIIDGYQSQGYSRVKGLRFSRQIVSANPDAVNFINSDGQNVQFSWDNTNKIISRSVDGGPVQKIPYYFPNSMSIVKSGSSDIFIFYDANSAVTSTASDVRSIKITFRVQSGSGNFQDWQHQVDFLSGVAVKKFQ